MNGESARMGRKARGVANAYEFADPGDSGQQSMVALDELLIDSTYQRQAVSEKVILSIVRNFNWAAFGAIVVMQRSDGRKFVVDGQQRVLAARKIGSIKWVPAEVFQSRGPEHEAQVFYTTNVSRTLVGAWAKFRAAIRGERSPEKEIAAWVELNGLQVVQGSRAANNIDFPSCLVNTWLLDERACQEALLVQADLLKRQDRREALHSLVHRGFWYLLHWGVDVRHYIDKIHKRGGKPRILREIRWLVSESQLRPNDRVCACGVLVVINYRLRTNRIALPETGRFAGPVFAGEGD